MKILILTTSTGQGHNSAAAAVAECMRSRGWEAETVDVLHLGRRNVSASVSHTYTSLVNRAPHVFGALYKAGEAVSSSRVHSPVYFANALNARPLAALLARRRPDAIVCTHIFSAQTLTCLTKRGLSTPTVGIMTDYTCSPFWEETRLARYVIPSENLLEEFAGKGIPRGKIVTAGIPVRAAFSKKTAKEEARRRFDDLSRLSRRNGDCRLCAADGRPAPLFAVMGGSMGFGNMKSVVRELQNAVPGCVVAAVCGSNARLLETLRVCENVVALPYTDTVDLLLDAADVVLTKPGGLSSTEAAVKRVPIVFTRPIPGGEERNAAFFERNGMAAVSGNAREAALAARRLVRDEGAARAMMAAQAACIHAQAAQKIGDLLTELTQSKEQGGVSCDAS